VGDSFNDGGEWVYMNNALMYTHLEYKQSFYSGRCHKELCNVM